MKYLFIEPSSGVAGDMFVAALLSQGIDFQRFSEVLHSLPISQHWDISLNSVSRNAISANLFSVEVEEGGDHSHHHHHHHHHHHRTLPEIEAIINGAEKLPDVVKENACKVFANLAEAEAKVHGKDIDAVHFHEVGAVDAIIDICGAALGLYMLEIDYIYSLPIALGTGTVKTAHGNLPIPVPATVNLLSGIPAEHTGIKSELATPTGVALLKTFVNEWNSPPSGYIVNSSGYGAGTRELVERAAVLRISQISIDNCSGSGKDEIAVLECNIDDMSGEVTSWVTSLIMDHGALDCSFTPIVMKKGRNAIMLQVICHINEVAKFADILLSETTTIGVRYRVEQRVTLNREVRKIKTSFGDVLVKIVKDSSGNIVKFKPEYDEIAKIAKREKLPFLQISDKIKEELSLLL